MALLVSAASGLVLFLANPPVALGPIAFVALIPFLWVLRRAGPGRGVLLGFAFGFAYLAATLYWILLFGTLAWAALSLASSAYVGLFGLLAPLLWRDDHPLRSAVGLAALWTGTEYLRSLWPLGGFTWGGLGYTQSDNGFLLPLASVAGVWGVTFVVLLVNALLLMALERVSGRRAAAAGLVVASLGAVILPAAIPIPGPNGRRIDVAVVQGNDFEHRSGILGRDYRTTLEIARSQARLHRTLVQSPPDLVVWPEDAVDYDPTRFAAFGRLVEESVKAVGAPTLVGAIVGPLRGPQFNAGLLYDGSGRLVGRYDKVHLVPFGEYVPWRKALGFVSAIRQIPYDLSAGRSVHSLAVDGLRFADAICFENSFPSLDRRLVAKGARFLVVSTNNASYRRTAASRQHLIMSRFRAVENGRWVVHAAISGISAFIDPRGHVFDATGLFQATVDRHTIQASSRRTVYSRFGDYLPWASLAAAGLLMMAPRRRPGRQSPDALTEHPRTLVVLPTYNERATVGPVLERTLRAAPDVDLLVVDDGSPDRTAEVVGGMAATEPRIRLLQRGRKTGLAGAYLAGFDRAMAEGYDLVVEMDADLSHQPEELPRLLEGARHHDLTIGSRYIRGGSVTNWGLLRRALSRGGNLYTRWALGLPVADATSGYRVFRRGLLRFLVEEGIGSEGYGFQIELAYRAWRAGYSVGEVPITFREREQGHSKISRRIVFEALARVALWALRDRLHVSAARETDHSRRRGSQEATLRRPEPRGSGPSPERRGREGRGFLVRFPCVVNPP